MKAKLKGKIEGVDRLDGSATIRLGATGKVDTTKINAQDISHSGYFKLKSVIADDIKIGATITITISDEELD